jgi:trigger factor
MTEALRAEARRYGDMAQRMFEFLRENPQAQAGVRAPLYEEKVVDLIIGRAKVTEVEVSKEKLFEEDELPEGISEPASGKKAAKPKAAAKAKAAPPKQEAAPAPADKPRAASKAKASAEPKAAQKAQPKAAAKVTKPKA